MSHCVVCCGAPNCKSVKLEISTCEFKAHWHCRWGEIQMWGWFLALAIPGGALVCCFSLGERSPTAPLGVIRSPIKVKFLEEQLG